MRKKTFLILTFALGMAFQLKAGIVELQSTGPADSSPIGPHNLVPTVTYDNDMITIKADTIYNDARVIVRNSLGKVLYNEHMNIVPAPQSLYVPANGKHSIEIVCDRERYFGFFKQ